MIITRFAPSPTGILHIGNIRVALINWLYARANNGKFILRIDDTDRERSKQEYVDGIKRDLEWLGLTWDQIYFQSDNFDKYEAVREDLIKSGRLYQCFESQEELEIKKKVQLSRNMPPIYDRLALKLTEEEKQQYIKDGKSYYYRFMLKGEPIEWRDLVRDQVHFEGKNISDPVLVRADGTMTYMIASVVDDVDLKITHIVRGEDHITNTAIQKQLIDAISSEKHPEFAHISLLKGKDEKISKRIGGFEIASLREKGVHPMAILSYLAKLGTSDPIDIFANMDELMANFDINRFSKSSCIYDPNEVDRLNAKFLHNSDFADIRDYLRNKDITKEFWEATKHNIANFNDIELWWQICKTNITPVIQDDELCMKASELLPQEPWSENTWQEWTNSIKEATGKKGKDLFMPIRLALTGINYGPELKFLLPMIGYKKVKERLLFNKK